MMEEDEDLHCYYSGLPSPSAYQDKTKNTEIMKDNIINEFHDSMTTEESRCERLRNLIGPMWNLPDMLKMFMNGEDLNERREFIQDLIKRIDESKPLLKKLMDPEISKEEIKKLYI